MSQMTYQQFLNMAIDREKKEVEKSFAGFKPHLEGGLAGLEACRDMPPPALAELLQRAWFVQHKAFHKTQLRRYWRVLSFYHEVEWICHVISVALINQGIDPIVRPSMLAAYVASDISKTQLETN